MAIHPNKIKQTHINLMHNKVIDLVDRAHANAVLIRASAEIGNTFTAGQLTALDGYIADLLSATQSAVSQFVKDNYIPSHKSKAYTISGVND